MINFFFDHKISATKSANVDLHGVTFSTQQICLFFCCGYMLRWRLLLSIFAAAGEQRHNAINQKKYACCKRNCTDVRLIQKNVK